MAELICYVCHDRIRGLTFGGKLHMFEGYAFHEKCFQQWKESHKCSDLDCEQRVKEYLSKQPGAE